MEEALSPSLFRMTYPGDSILKQSRFQGGSGMSQNLNSSAVEAFSMTIHSKAFETVFSLDGVSLVASPIQSSLTTKAWRPAPVCLLLLSQGSLTSPS
jgi:hypothetical protein